jgi:hypothetical protein
MENFGIIILNKGISKKLPIQFMNLVSGGDFQAPSDRVVSTPYIKSS